MLYLYLNLICPSIFHSTAISNCLQELHLHGNDIGNEGTRALMAGLTAHKGLPITYFFLVDYTQAYYIFPSDILLFHLFSCFTGRITLLDIGNNDIGPKGAFHVAEYIKKSKSLLWLNLYMNDIGDEVY